MARWSPIDQKVLFITSAGCSKETKDMILEEVQKYKKFDQIYMQEASAAITSNCGAGCFGLIYMLQVKFGLKNSIDILRKRVILRHIKIEYDLQGRV